MHHLLYTLLIVLTNNSDSLAVRIAYCLQGIRVSILMNLWISVIAFAVTFLVSFYGSLIAGSLGAKLSSVIAMVILVAIGSWMILEPYLKKRRLYKTHRGNSTSLWDILQKPENADMDHSKHIDFKEATLLGTALALQNIGGSLSGGMIGLDPMLIAVLSAVVSFVIFWGGNYLSGFFVRRNLAGKAAVAGGILLILIGLSQLP